MKVLIDDVLLQEIIDLLEEYDADEFPPGAEVLTKLKRVLNGQPINRTTSIDEGESSNTCSTGFSISC